MKNLIITYLLLLIMAQGCQESPKAEEIINNSIAFSGGEKYTASMIEFEFRQKKYKSMKENGKWEMTRIFSDNSNLYRDSYSLEGFERRINDSLIPVPDSMAFKYIESINSVFYFALLPYKLNDKAVISKLLGQETIKGNSFYKVMVRFQEEGGGVDHEDEFIYWFDSNDYSLDYLAYSFQVNGGGKRFRTVSNERFVNGIRFVDYKNYKTKKEFDIPLIELGEAYEEDKLELLSKIELTKLRVN